MSQTTMQQHTMQQMYPGPEMMGQAGYASPGGSGSTIGGVFWRRKGIVIFFLLCGLAGGYAFFTQQTPTYQAGATVEVVRRKANTGTDSAVEKVVDLAPGLAFIQAEITSDEVLRSAVEIGKLNSFEKAPSDASAMMGLIRANLQLLPAIEGAESIDRSIVQVIYESEDPALATAVVNSVVQAYDEYINGRHRREVEGVVGFFKEGRDSLLPKVEELEAEYSKFRGTAPLEWTANGEAVNPFREDAVRLEEALRKSETELRQFNTKLRLIEEASKTNSNAVAILREVQYLLDDVSNIQEIQQAVVNAPNSDLELQTKLMGLRVQAELLAGQFAPNHPSRQMVDNELSATEKALKEIQKTRESVAPVTVDVAARQEEAAKTLLRSYVNGLRKKSQLLTEDISDHQARLVEVREKASQLLAFENENASFQRRLARYQEMLDAFDSQLEKANLPAIESGLVVNVLRPAGMGYLVGPLLPRSLLLGAFVGTALGALIGLLVDWSERTFRNPDEVAATLDLQILAHLPLMLLGRGKKKKDGKEEQFAGVDPSLSVLHDPHSPGSEAIRSVRTALFSTATKKAEYQIIQVTSALPGDGKSTVVANLASSVAGAHKRVLIIDADLRRPTQAALFGVESETGLTDVLNGDCQAEEAIIATAVEGLDLMTTGPRPSNPAEALMLPEFGQLLDDLRSEYDLILVDTPPVLAVTDACNVANNVDGVMFVMRIGRNVKPMAKRAITLLRALHVNMIGVIVNAIGDSGYSATYANAWSSSYGGQPGSEYGYAYYRYGSDRYLSASKGQSVTVRGRSDRKSRSLQPTISDDTADQPSDA